VSFDHGGEAKQFIAPAFLGALINPRYLANDSRSSDGAAFVPHT
jgi:hypothetical protein